MAWPYMPSNRLMFLGSEGIVLFNTEEISATEAEV